MASKYSFIMCYNGNLNDGLRVMRIYQWIGLIGPLAGGLELFLFSHILGIIIPID